MTDTNTIRPWKMVALVAACAVAPGFFGALSAGWSMADAMFMGFVFLAFPTVLLALIEVFKFIVRTWARWLLRPRSRERRELLEHLASMKPMWRD